MLCSFDVLAGGPDTRWRQMYDTVADLLSLGVSFQGGGSSKQEGAHTLQ